MPRQARLDSPGTLHHVMIRGIEGRPIVDDDQDRRDFVRRLGDVAVVSGTTIYAWALLSNHAHILLSSGVSGLAPFIRRLLTVTSQQSGPSAVPRIGTHPGRCCF